MSILPWWWRWAGLALLVLATYAKGNLDGRAHELHEREIERAAAVQAQNNAIVARVADNKKLGEKQAQINQLIEDLKNAELQPVIARIESEPRVRVGAAICGGSASSTQAESTGGSDGADSRGWLVREDVDRDLKALKIAVEQDLATGRACQAFARDNGLVP